MEKEQIVFGEQLFCNSIQIIAQQGKLNLYDQIDLLVARLILSESIKLN